jgi:hypothetical protein
VYRGSGGGEKARGCEGADKGEDRGASVDFYTALWIYERLIQIYNTGLPPVPAQTSSVGGGNVPSNPNGYGTQLKNNAKRIFNTVQCMDFLLHLFSDIYEAERLTVLQASIKAFDKVMLITDYINGNRSLSVKYGGPSPKTAYNHVTYITLASANYATGIKYYDGIFNISEAAQTTTYIGEVIHYVGPFDLEAAKALGYKGNNEVEASAYWHPKVGEYCK